jgi:steroid 5-alpha reductase family enzyme
MSSLILSTTLSASLTIALYMTGWFLLALKMRRNDLADVAWGPGFILVAWVTLLSNNAFTVRPILIASLITLWGLRLAWHIFQRNRGRGEDFRYKKWRDDWGKWFYVRSFLQIFMLQGLLLLMVVSPQIIVTSTDISASLNTLSFLGLAIFLVGFFFEAIGDLQLARFLAQKDRGPIMNTGLWKYTRHPNYFGEVSLWWGIFLIGLSSPMGWLGILGPMTITILILGVSGIPMLERKYVGNPDYEAYQKSTSAFFPLPPK